MATPADSNSSGKSGKMMRYVWIIGALAALGIVLSPVSPLSVFQQQHQSSQQAQSQVGSSNNTNSSAITNAANATIGTAALSIPRDMSTQDLALCESLDTSVNSVIAASANYNSTASQQQIPANLTNTVPSSSNSTNANVTHAQNVASNLLTGEACNRLALLHNVSATYDPGTTLVAYGCDAASGKIGDADLQDALNNYNALYCNAAVLAIQKGAATILSNVQSEKSILAAQGSTQVNATSTASALDKITELANRSTENLVPGSMYQDALLLSQGSSIFANVVQTATPSR